MIPRDLTGAVVSPWWYHTGGITTFEAFWSETHPHVPLTQIWLRDMNFSTRLSAIHFADQKIRALKIAFSHVLITRESNPGLRIKYRRMQPPCSANRCIEVPIAAEILITIVLMHYVYELVVSRHKTRCRACGFSNGRCPCGRDQVGGKRGCWPAGYIKQGGHRPCAGWGKRR